MLQHYDCNSSLIHQTGLLDKYTEELQWFTDSRYQVSATEQFSNQAENGFSFTTVILSDYNLQNEIAFLPHHYATRLTI